MSGNRMSREEAELIALRAVLTNRGLLSSVEIKDMVTSATHSSVTETLPDAHRQLIVVLVANAFVKIREDPEMNHEARELSDIIKRFSGTDTRVTIERAYPSGASS